MCSLTWFSWTVKTRVRSLCVIIQAQTLKAKHSNSYWSVGIGHKTACTWHALPHTHSATQKRSDIYNACVFLPVLPNLSRVLTPADRVESLTYKLTSLRQKWNYHQSVNAGSFTCLFDPHCLRFNRQPQSALTPKWQRSAWLTLWYQDLCWSQDI